MKQTFQFSPRPIPGAVPRFDANPVPIARADEADDPLSAAQRRSDERAQRAGKPTPTPSREDANEDPFLAAKRRSDERMAKIGKAR